MATKYTRLSRTLDALLAALPQIIGETKADGTRKLSSGTALRIIREHNGNHGKRSEMAELASVLAADLLSVTDAKQFESLMEKLRDFGLAINTNANSQAQWVVSMHKMKPLLSDEQYRILRNIVKTPKETMTARGEVAKQRLDRGSDLPHDLDVAQYLDTVAKWRDSKQIEDQMLYLLAVTGRREVEIFTATYRVVDARTLEWSDLAKKAIFTGKKTDSATTVVAPLLPPADSADVAARLESLRAHYAALIPRGKTVITNTVNARLNKRVCESLAIFCRDDAGNRPLTLHSLRAIYAILWAKVFNPQRGNRQAEMKRVLGHANIAVVQNYDRIELVNIPEHLLPAKQAAKQERKVEVPQIAELEAEIKRLTAKVAELQIELEKRPLPHRQSPRLQAMAERHVAMRELENKAQRKLTGREFAQRGYSAYAVRRYRQAVPQP